jgi:hypothetical protein
VVILEPLTDQPVRPYATCGDNDQAEREDTKQSDLLRLWYRVQLPCEKARQRHRVDVANRSADTGHRVDDACVHALIVLRQGVLEVKRHPVRTSGCAVGQKNDAEGKGVSDGEGDREPDEPLVSFRVSAGNETTVEQEDGDFGAAAADQERELSKPHAQHQCRSFFGRRIPDVTVSMSI